MVNEMTPARREQLEMAGYSWGRSGSRTVYHQTAWTAEETAAFNKGFKDGWQYSKVKGEVIGPCPTERTKK